MEVFVDIVVILLSIVGVFVVGETLRQKNVSVFVTRKVVHIGGGIVAASLPFYLSMVEVLLVAVGLTAFLLFSKVMGLLSSVHGLSEESTGVFLFAPAIALTTVTFWSIDQLIFQGAMLVFGLADGLAALVGKRYGTISYFITGNKTLEGSLTFFTVTVMVVVFITIKNDMVFNLSLFGVVCLGSALVTAVEGMLGKGWDNLVIPLCAGLMISVILF